MPQKLIWFKGNISKDNPVGGYVFLIRTFKITMRLLYLLFLLVFACPGFGQLRTYASFELAGSGGLASFNFERCFYQGPKHAISPQNRMFADPGARFQLYWRAGFSVAPIDKNNGVALVFPLMIHTVYGLFEHKLDFGIGQTISITTKGQFFPMLPASLGYRFEPEEKNYYLRFAYTPIISYLFNFQWQHWGGITFGYKIGERFYLKKNSEG